MAACATLWRAWAQASYPGMTLADMLPRLAVMSGRGQVKASAAAMRESDAHLVEAQRDRVRLEGGTPSKQVPGAAEEVSARHTPATGTPALPSPALSDGGAFGRAPASAGRAGAGVGQDLIEEAEAAMREEAAAGAARSSGGAAQSKTRMFDDEVEADEEDYGALGVNLDDF